MPIKLINKGQRVIHFATGEKGKLHPGKGLSFPDELGKKLKKLFPGELIDTDDATSQFAEISEEEPGDDLPDEGAPLSEMTLPQLKAVAKGYKISFPKAITAESLIAKIEAHEAALPAGDDSEEEPGDEE